MASAYLTRTPSGGNYKIATFSAWVKRSNISSGEQHLISFRSNDTYQFNIKFKSDDTIRLTDYAGATNMQIDTNRVFRDTNAWYHIVASFDSTQSTASNRAKLWINGVQETSFSTATYPNLNGSMQINGNISSNLVGAYSSSNYYFDGSMSHVHWIDGTQYQASDFGETDSTTGIWKPKTAPSVTYGTNGFFLKFENSASMGTDSSGNTNNFTVNGTMTKLIDTPNNVFATLNSLATSTTLGSFSNGNTTHTKSDGVWASTTSTLAASSGKYYAEYKFTANSSSSNGQMAAIVNMDLTNYMNENSDLEQSGNKGITYYPNGTVFADPQTTVATYSSYGDAIIQIAMDLDNGFLYFGKDGTWQNSGDPTSGATGTGGINISNYIGTGTYAFGLANRNTGSTSVNFGNGYFGTTAVTSAQNPDDGIGIFEYDVPAGYRALCTRSVNAEEYS